MSQVIYKYPLKHGVNRLELPSGSKILTVRFQGPVPTLWALTTELKTTDEHYIEVRFTGEKFTPALNDRYIATDESADGFVIHAFEQG